MNNPSTETTISSVTDSRNNPAPLGGSIQTTSLTFEGTAEAGSSVRLFDGDTPLTLPVPANAEGHWALTLDDVASGPHRFNAKHAKHPDGAMPPDSWSLTVAEPRQDHGIVHFDTFPFGPLPVDQELPCGYGMTMIISGDGANIAPNVVPDSGDHALQPSANCHVRFNFNGAVNHVIILHSGARSLHNLFRFYDAQGNVVKGASMESPDNLTRVSSVEMEKDCSYLDAVFIDHSNKVLLDALVWTHS